MKLLFRWTDDMHIRARTYDELVWKAALARACVIPMPGQDARGRRQYKISRDTGRHALRHYYASITVADGVDIKELAEYLMSGSRATFRGHDERAPERTTSSAPRRTSSTWPSSLLLMPVIQASRPCHPRVRKALTRSTDAPSSGPTLSNARWIESASVRSIG